MANIDPRDVVDRLDGWVNELAAPLVPPRVISEGRAVRFEFRAHTPQAVMVGKIVRAVSGLRAALVLDESGYVSEAASLLRIVSDFCIEITAIGEALSNGGELPRSVQTFVGQYFTPQASEPGGVRHGPSKPLCSTGRVIESEGRMARSGGMDDEEILAPHRFINQGLDAYVHGAYETTMELCDGQSGRFAMRGHPSPDTRDTFRTFALLKVHEVVRAIEIAAAVTGNGAVLNAAREALRAMDASRPWREPEPCR